MVGEQSTDVPVVFTEVSSQLSTVDSPAVVRASLMKCIAQGRNMVSTSLELVCVPELGLKQETSWRLETATDGMLWQDCHYN